MPAWLICLDAWRCRVQLNARCECLCWGLHLSYQCAAYAVVINVKLYIININCSYGGLEAWEWVNSWDKLLSLCERSTGSIHGNMTLMCLKFTFLVQWVFVKVKCLWRILLPKFPSWEDAKLCNQKSPFYVSISDLGCYHQSMAATEECQSHFASDCFT